MYFGSVSLCLLKITINIIIIRTYGSNVQILLLITIDVNGISRSGSMNSINNYYTRLKLLCNECLCCLAPFGIDFMHFCRRSASLCWPPIVIDFNQFAAYGSAIWSLPQIAMDVDIIHVIKTLLDLVQIHCLV